MSRSQASFKMANQSGVISNEYQLRQLGWEFNGYQPSALPFEMIGLKVMAESQGWIEDHWQLPCYVAVIYIVTIFGLQHYMKSRPAFELKLPLFYWNLFLGIFSIVAYVRTVPTFLYLFTQPNGFYTSICSRSYMNHPMAFWMLMFGLSKYVELGDTLFIVLRKRPIVFLQWYHHALTMIYVWWLAPFVEPVTYLLSVNNFGVHACMYPYFALKAIGISVPKKIASTITFLQLAQMIFAVFANVLTVYLHKSGHDCDRHPLSIKFTLLVFSSFGLLFAKLFYETVLSKGRTTRKSAKLE